jgi:predicted transcriptional regulator
MDTFVKKGCFRRCFLNLLSKTALFCKNIFELALGIQHHSKLIFLFLLQQTVKMKKKSMAEDLNFSEFFQFY